MDYINIAINKANCLGADYADIRIQKTNTQIIYLRNLSLKHTNNTTQYGYGIRIFKNGCWGFAHCNIFTKKAIIDTVTKAFEIAKLSATVKASEKGLTLASERSYIDTYKTPLKINPFTISIPEKIDLMLEVNRTLLSYKQIKQAMFMLKTQQDDKLFGSSIGTRLNISTTFIHPYVSATAVNDVDSQSRTFDEGPKAIGWEWINQLNLIDKANQIAEEAIIKLNAGTLGEDKRRSLILYPGHLGLTMHESVGHPTELDRVLGWEADFAGLSFATTEKLKNYKYGSDIINFIADNTLKTGLATAGYDDDGVPNQKWHIIKDGILNEYGTTRDTAPFINQSLSRGCNRATNYYDMPINRIPNLYLQPGKKLLTPSQLISDTEDGVLIQGRGSFSIDQHRVNFQFGGDFFWEIKNGKKVRPLKKVLYKSNNPEFWNSCDAICDERFFETFGIGNCGKGQPMQAGRMTHGSSPARFTNIRVGGSK